MSAPAPASGDGPDQAGNDPANDGTRAHAHALVRHGPGVPSLRASLPAERAGVRLPRLRQGPGHRVRLRARGAPLRGGAALAAPAEHLALRGALAESPRRHARRRAWVATRATRRSTPCRPPRRRARAVEPVSEGRLDLCARASPTRTGSWRCRSPGCSSWDARRSAASRPATSAPRSPRSPPRRASMPTCSTPTASRT